MSTCSNEQFGVLYIYGSGTLVQLSPLGKILYNDLFVDQIQYDDLFAYYPCFEQHAYFMTKYIYSTIKYSDMSKSVQVKASFPIFWHTTLGHTTWNLMYEIMNIRIQISTLKTGNHRDANSVTKCVTASCHNDNLHAASNHKVDIMATLWFLYRYTKYTANK